MSHHKIEFSGVSFNYPDGTKALGDCSFLITHGESVGILGANGAGKSTLLLLLMGILFPVTGNIFVGDTKLTSKTLQTIRSHLGLVFQNPDDQLFMNTIFDDVAFGPRNIGLEETEVEKRVTDALVKTGTAHIGDKAPYRCSGGEKRAAAIAGILAMQPDILVLDEPTSELDPLSRRNTIELLREFSHTKIVASHDIDMVYELCERTLIINKGRIAADGKTSEIVTNESLMRENGLLPPLCLY